MQQIDNTRYFVFKADQLDQLTELLTQVESAGPIAPSDCGPMVRIGDQKDVIFLEQALA